jgi:hypothetical protein
MPVLVMQHGTGEFGYTECVWLHTFRRAHHGRRFLCQQVGPIMRYMFMVSFRHKSKGVSS